MFHAFTRSRISYYAVLALSLVIAVAVWFRDRGYPFFVPLIASALTLCIGYIGARLLANILSGSENTRILGYLHMELDPEKFIAAYRKVPALVKGDSNAAVCRSYLADGYAAAGDYDQAIALLHQSPPAGQLPLEGLYEANLAGFHLNQGDPEGAAPHLERLNRIIDACRLDKASLSRNLMEMQQIHLQHLACLTGKPVDTGVLEASFENAQYHLRRLEIRKILAMTAIREQDASTRDVHLRWLQENGGQTIYQKWSAQQVQ